MQYDLKDKVIIIIGASSGIGKAASIQLARMGAMVVMACRSGELLTSDIEHDLD